MKVSVSALFPKMSRFSNIELAHMVRVYAIANDNVREAIRLYREMFPNREIHTYHRMLSATQMLRTVWTRWCARALPLTSSRWIGRGGPVAWPARSPDLTPLDFYLWGDVKRRVYATEFQTRTDLINRIRSAFEIIKNDTFILNRLHNNLRKRAALCITRNGEHFEHLLHLV